MIGPDQRFSVSRAFEEAGTLHAASVITAGCPALKSSLNRSEYQGGVLVKESRLLASCVAFAALVGSAASFGLAQPTRSASKVTVQFLATLEGQDAVRILAFPPDGKTLAAGGDDCTVWLWDIPSRKPRATLGDHLIDTKNVAFSPDGKKLAVTSGGESLKIWDVRTGRKVLDWENRSGGLTCVAFSPDGQMMATAGMRLGLLKSATGVVKWRQTKEGAVEQSLVVQD